MAKKRYYDSRIGNEYYAGMAGSRTQQRMDGEMISEDMTAPSNLPQGVIMKDYPKIDYANYDLNDTIAGVDYQMKEDMKGKKKGRMPEKY